MIAGSVDLVSEHASTGIAALSLPEGKRRVGAA